MDLFALAAKITLDSDAYEKGLERAKGLWSGFTSVVKTGYAGLETGAKVFTTSSKAIVNAMEGISKVGDTAIKTISGVSAAAGASAAALGKLSLDQYADYEQLIGGVDTLFKEASWDVQMFAENAYKTAGLSANEYMETVTSFSASLLQALGGDTAEAAKKADMAITDMSDNANKMGTSMEMIQNAYQGFAKQNYTMLDNLKLGYGGTKEEMERLLEDATALSGVEYNIESYADVVDALHVIQTEMGITGTTAKEASSTISGSFASLQASAKNLLTAFASDEIPIDEVISQTLDSLVTYGDNVIPRIEQIFHNVTWVIEDYVDDVGTLIGNLSLNIAQKAPEVIEAGFNLINTMTSGLTKNSGAIRAAGESIIGSLAEGISGAVTNLEPVSGDIVGGLASGFITYKGLTLDVGVQVLGYIVDGIHENLGMIERESKAVLDKFVAQVTNPERLEELSGKGADILIALGNGISYASSQLYGAALDVVIAFGKGLVEKNAVYELTTAAGEVITNFIGGFTPERIDDIFTIGEAVLGQFIDAVAGGNDTEGALSKITTSALKVVTHLGNKLVEKAPDMAEKAGELIERFVGWFGEPENLTILDGAAASIVKGVFALTTSAIEVITGWATGAINSIVDYFKGTTAEEKFEDAAKVGGAIWSSEFVTAVREGIGDIWEVLGLNWISDPIVEIAKNTKTNIIDPIAELLEPVDKALSDIGGKISTNAGFEPSSSFYASDGMLIAPTITEEKTTTGGGGTTNGGGVGRTTVINQNIYAQAQTPSELMQEAMYRAEEAVLFSP